MTSKPFSSTRRQALLMGAASTFLPAIAGAARAAPISPVRVGRGQPFDLGWKFFKGAGDGLEAKAVDDSKWRVVDLPHDWSIEDLPPMPDGKQAGPFYSKAEGATATGYAVGGEGWYRKSFMLAKDLAGSHVEVVFGGVNEVADVWLNGQHISTHYHGYTEFVCDLTPYLVVGENVLAVRARNIGRTSRWYSGSGIYRSVTLDVVSQAARIANRGVSVMTRRISDAGAQVDVATDMADLSPGLSLVTSIRDAQGHVVASTASAAAAHVAQSLIVPSPALWSPASPALYSVETEVRKNKQTIDRMVTPLGIRIVTFDAENGMQINGEPTKLRGGCVHADNGLLGAASYPDAEDRRMRVMKARGYNAIRCSHNPPSQAFADAADRNGMLLLVEAFDCWLVGKNPQDYSVYFKDHWREDLTSMVLSHRNHPSVIMWSIGNEIPHRSAYAGVEIEWQLANAVRTIDPTRPVTAAINGFNGRLVKPDADTARPGLANVPDENAVIFLDVVGYNYKLPHYEADHANFPKRIMFGTESFPKDVFDIWSLTETKPYLLGDFVWVAMDYLGETGVGANQWVKPQASAMPNMGGAGWPWVDAYCGDIDLIGEPKAASRARDVVWAVSPLEIAVQRPGPDGMIESVSQWGWSDELASWSWAGSEGKPLRVTLYARADHVDLYLNDQKVGAKDLTSADKLQAQFTVPYAPGVLRAVASRGGVEIAHKTLTTLGAPAAVRLNAETKAGRANRNALTYVSVAIVDAEGRPLPDAVNDLTLTVDGPAEIVGFGSGYPKARGSFQSNATQTYYGRALAILRSKGKAGAITVTVKSEGLLTGSTRFLLT